MGLPIQTKHYNWKKIEVKKYMNDFLFIAHQIISDQRLREKQECSEIIQVFFFDLICKNIHWLTLILIFV